MKAEIVGFSALALGLVYRVPQIYKIYRLKSGEDVSEKTLHVQNSSYTLYIVYGVMKNDVVFIASSAIGIVQNLILLCMKRYYRENEKTLPS